MSIRFQAGNDLNRLIVAATFRREPGIDFQTAQTAQLDYLDDEAVLRRAAAVPPTRNTPWLFVTYSFDIDALPPSGIMTHSLSFGDEIPHKPLPSGS